VTTRLLGKGPGVVCGCALVLDYILTIAISIASCVELTSNQSPGKAGRGARGARLRLGAEPPIRADDRPQGIDPRATRRERPRASACRRRGRGIEGRSSRKDGIWGSHGVARLAGQVVACTRNDESRTRADHRTTFRGTRAHSAFDHDALSIGAVEPCHSTRGHLPPRPDRRSLNRRGKTASASAMRLETSPQSAPRHARGPLRRAPAPPLSPWASGPADAMVGWRRRTRSHSGLPDFGLPFDEGPDEDASRSESPVRRGTIRAAESRGRRAGRRHRRFRA
jgi:hypothetical protein